MPKLKVILVEMRPAFDGFAGIPQETRLLFRGLASSHQFETEGFLQNSTRFLPNGKRLDRHARQYSELVSIGSQARRIISIEEPVKRGLVPGVLNYLRKRLVYWRLALASILNKDRTQIGVDRLDTTVFQDYIWNRLFSKTLQASDFSLVSRRQFHTCDVPWNVLQSAGLLTRTWSGHARYPKVDMSGADFFIAQTPYPGRIPDTVTMIVRYHDAFPITMPHTIANRVRHHDTHFHALRSNAESGAYFSCVSEATRRDLIKLLPEVESRSVTIHNMLPASFYDAPAADEDLATLIERYASKDARLAPQACDTQPEQNVDTTSAPRYLLFVSTIEPRKNHTTLISAWETYTRTIDPDLKLILVGRLGWEFADLVPRLKEHIAARGLAVLSDVSSQDLKCLYRNAAATICPSLAEGFDFSGVESMACGGAVIASDIPVHREIYDEAALYFETYSADNLVTTLKNLLTDTSHPSIRDRLVSRGRDTAMRYHPDRIIPQWEAFLASLSLRPETNGSAASTDDTDLKAIL